MTAAAALCAVALVLSGCGGNGEEFSAGESDRALAALDAVQEFVDEGRCTAAQRRVQLMITQAAHVNQDRQDLGSAYAKSAERLQQLVERDCVEVKESSPTPATGETGSSGPTETPEPTKEPQPEPQPTNGGAAPQQPANPDDNNNQDNGNGGEQNQVPPESGGVRPQ